MCRVVLFHLVEGDDVDIKECVEELEDDAVGCEGDSAVDDIVTFVDDIEDSGGLARSIWLNMMPMIGLVARPSFSSRLSSIVFSSRRGRAFADNDEAF